MNFWQVIDRQICSLSSAYQSALLNGVALSVTEKMGIATNLESTETSEGSEPSEDETTEEPAPAEDAKEN